MTLRDHLDTAIHALPQGRIMTALLAATRPDWGDESNYLYCAAMSRDELEEAFVTLCRMVAEYGAGCDLTPAAEAMMDRVCEDCE